MKKFYLCSFLLLLFFASAGFAQVFKITGKVTEASSGEPLVGANVYLVGTTTGTATDENGEYLIPVEKGVYTITCSFIGYERVEREVSVDADVTENFNLKEHQFTLSVTVISDRAKERETPVAFTDVRKRDIEQTLGSRDIPLVLNSTPSIFATNYGGGAGDARVSVRGFNQRNVAIMINGIPINDMENGWVYWSNWDGLGDATSSIQVQRGLSAVNLATPSIGGTVNIITDPTLQKASVLYQNENGTGGFTKQTLFAHTGLIDNKFALSIGGVRKAADGIADKTWTDAWAYYLGTAYQIDDNNRLELYAMGAPQQHGQRRWLLNTATYSHELARELGFSEQALRDPKLREQGILYNSNWNGVSSSYQGMQFQKSYWNTSIGSRYNNGFINESVNYFHKPLVNMNWYSQLTGDLSLYSTVYWSGGQGGGAGTFGTMVYDTQLMQRVVDWDATIASNLTHLDTVNFGNGPVQYIVSTDRRNDTIPRGGILRNSVNNQWQLGAISKAFYKVNQNLNTSFGIDWRIAEIEHYREVRDLLGNDYFHFNGNEFESGLQYFKKLGDKIDYNNTNTVHWLGGYLQGEWSEQIYTFYATAGYSVVKYDYVDHFKKDISTGDELNLVSDWIGGYQFKGGASFRLSPEADVYFNAGYVSKVPIFDQVISDVNATLIDNPKNEKFLSFEIGANSRLLENQLSLKANLYYTDWSDRTINEPVTNRDGSDGLVRFFDVSSRHMGIELEGAFQPLRFLRLDAALSYGMWEYTDDVSGIYIINFSTDSTQERNGFLKDLKVGDAPQTQLALGLSIFPIPGLQAQLIWRYYDNYYSNFNPLDRNDLNDRAQVWKIPSYNLFDAHVSYRIPEVVAGADVAVFMHVFNLFNELYVEDAVDNSDFNAYSANGKNHSADDAEIYPGLPVNFNIGFRVVF